MAPLDAARAALKQGDHPAAIRHARQALADDPDNQPARWLWAVAAIDLYAFDEAETVIAEQLRRLPPDHPSRIPWLAQHTRVLGPLGRQAEAVAAARQALILLDSSGLPGDGATLHRLGVALSEAGQTAEALPVLRHATDLSPAISAYWKTRGETEQFLGLIDAAEHSYEQAISAKTFNWAAYLALARLKCWTAGHNHIDRLLAAPAHTPLHRACQGYALFKEYDNIGDTAAAWDWLQKGAAAARAEPATPRRPAWSASDEAAITDAWKTAFPPDRFAHLPVAANRPRRLFIVGLPRSGTTLIERILGAHSQVQALGELPTFPVAVKTISGTTSAPVIDAETLMAVSRANPQAIADFYAHETRWLEDGAPCVTDKLPHNSGYAGLIRLAFPDAAIIHVRRQPMDALFGAYRLYFAAGWSFDLDDLADHYAQYRAQMAHWQTCLGDGLIDVSLEALIADPDMQIRQLLAVCGLTFEAACLSPHASAGAVTSASSTQVRKPINAEGVGAWRRYAAQLEPLRARLEAMGFVDRNGNAV